MNTNTVVQPILLKHTVKFHDEFTNKEEEFVLSYTQSEDRYNRFDIKVNGFISGTLLDFNNPSIPVERMQTAAISTYLRWRNLYSEKIAKIKTLSGSSAPLRAPKE